MGEVRAKVLLRNFGDVVLAERGFITKDQIVTTERNFLVDTGAVMVMLPQDEVETLKLLQGDKVIVTYADERKDTLYTARGLEITIGNRTMVTDCIVGPPLSEPLLGQIVLEELDLIVDCANQQLTPRPESKNMPLLKLK